MPSAVENFVVEMWPVDKLIPYARNPRKNDQAVTRMVSSIREFGFKIPVLARSTGDVVDGHLRLKAAQKLKLEQVPVMLCDEWTDAQVKAFRLMVNRSVTWASWDNDLLALEFQELKDLGFDLKFTGFDEDEWSDLLGGDQGGRGSILSRMDITIKEPRTVVEHGDVWRMQRHVLVCVSVIDEWPAWNKYLVDDALFCPFPGPFVLLSEKASTHPLVLVQPDAYIAGHVLDRYVDIHGEDAIRRESQVQVAA